MAESLPIQLISLSEDLSLVPVVEISPLIYARTEHDTPDCSVREDPDGWHLYWKKSLADAGIHDLEPLKPGSWLVPVHRLVSPHLLHPLLRSHFERASTNIEEEAETVCPLVGGHALLDAGRVIIEPRCCVDLGAFDSWSNAVQRRTDYFWIGHPTAHATLQRDELVIRENEEHYMGAPFLRAWRMSLEALARTIPAAAQAQEAFSRRLEPLLAEFLPHAIVPGLARRLAGLDGR